MEYLKGFWDRELAEIRYRVVFQKNKDMIMLSGLEEYNEDFALSLLKLYLERCKLRHSMAFF